MSINYLFYPYSRVDIMAGFHPPGDSYFLNQGDGGWLEAEPEEEFKEEMYEDSDSELKSMINL